MENVMKKNILGLMCVGLLFGGSGDQIPAQLVYGIEAGYCRLRDCIRGCSGCLVSTKNKSVYRYHSRLGFAKCVLACQNGYLRQFDSVLRDNPKVFKMIGVQRKPSWVPAAYAIARETKGFKVAVPQEVPAQLVHGISDCYNHLKDCMLRCKVDMKPHPVKLEYTDLSSLGFAECVLACQNEYLSRFNRVLRDNPDFFKEKTDKIVYIPRYGPAQSYT